MVSGGGSLGPEILNILGTEVSLSRSGNGPPLLLLHGADGMIFSSQFRCELARSFTVLAPLHPGWDGRHLPDHVDSVVDIAELYQNMLKELDLSLPVIGLSIGGWIAAQMAATHPGRITELALVSPLGIKVGSRESRDFVDIYLAEGEIQPSIWYSDPARVPALYDRSEDEFLSLAHAQESVARFAWEPYLHDPKLRHRLQNIQIPTLILYGTADQLVIPTDYYTEYADLIGLNAQAKGFSDVGHRLEEEMPVHLAEELLSFLQPDPTRQSSHHE